MGVKYFNIINLFGKTIFILTIVFLHSCFSYAYQKRFEPYGIDDYQREFQKDKKISIGRNIADPKDNLVKAQFDSILVGEGRQLNITINPNDSKAEVFDTYEFQQGNKAAVLFYDPTSFSKVFNKEDRKVNLKDMFIPESELKEKMYFYRIDYDLIFVELERSKEDNNFYIKKMVPTNYRFDRDQISRRERSLVINTFKYGLFYAGYILTIPLDAITGIFQVAAYILVGGGVK